MRRLGFLCFIGSESAVSWAWIWARRSIVEGVISGMKMGYDLRHFDGGYPNCDIRYGDLLDFSVGCSGGDIF
jgi:hypothetical protein